MRPAVGPIVVSDATALSVVGLTPRQFRDFASAHREALGPVKAGRRMLVRVDRLLALLDWLGGAAPLRGWDEDGIVALAARAGRR